jgi:hypothetical protein
MAKRFSFDHVTKIATTDDGLSIMDTVFFHCFNPRGVVAAQRQTDAAIMKLIDEGKVKGGAMFAYGPLDDYSYKRMTGFVQKKPKHRRDLNVAIYMYKERNKAAAAYLRECGVTV